MNIFFHGIFALLTAALGPQQSFMQTKYFFFISVRSKNKDARVKYTIYMCNVQMEYVKVGYCHQTHLLCMLMICHVN